MPKTARRVPVLPFRHFFTYAEMEAFLKKLAAARPKLAALDSLGTSREGRNVYCLTLTDPKSGPPGDKPAYLIHGNIHAAELSGTHAALFTARQLLADYPRRTDLLRRVAFHIVPRLNPDGAEFVVTTSGTVRSRTDRTDLPPNTLVQKDVDSNGLILRMRLRRPDGDRVADPKDKRLLIRRRAGAKGPFYKVYPEGEILNWDGSDNITVEGRSIDWNRQWAYDWQPEPDQHGAGDFPYSEPEMRCLAELIRDRPNLFGILGYHTGPAAMLRPPSAGSDDDLDEADLRKMQDLARVGAEYTRLPVVPVYRYCPKQSRGISLHGHFPSTGYQHFGLFVFEFELGTIVDSAGMGFDEVMSWETDEQREAGDRRVLRWWDRRGRKPAIFVPWKPFDHPQLGRVEIGGRVWRHWAGMTLDDLRKRSAATYRFTLHHAAQHPRVTLEEIAAEAVGGGIYRVRARVANRGALPTNVSHRGAKLKRLQTVRVEFQPGKGVEVLSRRAHHDLGHLAGPGGSTPLEWFVRAPKRASCRIVVKGGTGGNAAVTHVPG
jgi:hypothetical protein